MSAKRNGSKWTRRQFSATVAAGVLGVPTIVRGRNLNSKLDIAIIGAGSRGAANTKGLASENIVALCDVDANNLGAAAAKYPKAKKFVDFRQLFERPGDFDAVAVSTCEHTHAAATMLALKHKKHVFCEKPLTHDIWEARQIRLAADEAGVATQMGIQMHATENYRRVVERIQTGAIGDVSEVHVWVSRAWGLQSAAAAKRHKDIAFYTDRPRNAEPTPDNLDWDLWLGPAKERPFHSAYFPGPKWYRWWDFGNGTMSDLGSHWNDLPFWALKLKYPLTIDPGMPSAHPEIAPASMQATYEYGPRERMGPVRFTWYQGENKPRIWKDKKIPQWNNGHLFIGTKGMLLSDYRKHVLLPEEQFADVSAPEPFLPRVATHYAEWIAACKTGSPTGANFEYSGWLTEANHLGNVAYRAGKKLYWDHETMRATNAPEADRFIRCPYRDGWEII